MSLCFIIVGLVDVPLYASYIPLAFRWLEIFPACWQFEGDIADISAAHRVIFSGAVPVSQL